jgi:hypothetical protein
MPSRCPRRDLCREPSSALHRRRAGRCSSCRSVCCWRKTVSWCHGVENGGKGVGRRTFRRSTSLCLGLAGSWDILDLVGRLESLSARTTREVQTGDSYSRGCGSDCRSRHLQSIQTHLSTGLSQEEGRTYPHSASWNLEPSLPQFETIH